MKYGLKWSLSGSGTYTFGGRMTLVAAGNNGSTGIVSFTPLPEPASEGLVPESTKINPDFELIFTNTKSIDIMIDGLRMAKVAMTAFEQGKQAGESLSATFSEEGYPND